MHVTVQSWISLMSSTVSFLSKWAWNIVTFKDFPKSFAINIIILQGFNVLSLLPKVEARRSVFDIPCIVVENCSEVTGDIMCDASSGMCSCADGHVRMHRYYHCLPYVGMGEFCQDTEQCKLSDPYVICSKWSQRCQCTTGYEEQENNSTKLCLKSRNSENEPYFVHIFSGLDTVHIVLGCLTGGLALLACFAGIFQLVRKKFNGPRCSDANNPHFSSDLGFSTTSAPSQSQPYSDSQFTTEPPSGGDFACLDGNSTAPPTPGTLGDEDYVVTPPPTYEEALQSGRGKGGSTVTV